MHLKLIAYKDLKNDLHYRSKTAPRETGWIKGLLMRYWVFHTCTLDLNSIQDKDPPPGGHLITCEKWGDVLTLFLEDTCFKSNELPVKLALFAVKPRNELTIKQFKLTFIPQYSNIKQSFGFLYQFSSQLLSPACSKYQFQPLTLLQ